ncbi:MAG: helix-turn-helix domain-containing protein [Lachnospiraceae bacterium]|nr:helix-turn-helix domain-containing protein [Parasporobacterium sp.]MBR3308650.1 helix-turn-helix domain-containing protein [Lachnospiraceae bacterium]MBR3360175.1 helix-turn-helix domain-containing protein [Lachnospiraceae bacterium]MBR7076889.1 helix-turn-helix domain-containing protein [Lachnospiraceae bacterium]
MSSAQAAEALFIHRTTLFRRMNQIKELTGLDLDDSDLMLELQLSYRILDR